jgi:hypothetical protein
MIKERHATGLSPSFDRNGIRSLAGARRPLRSGIAVPFFGSQDGVLLMDSVTIY